MRESRYRESRLCRALGNPIVYRIVVLLAEHGPLTPSAIAGEVGRRIGTVSTHLAKLRSLDLVRYETAGRQTRYWLKHPLATRIVLRSLRRFVATAAPIRD